MGAAMPREAQIKKAHLLREQIRRNNATKLSRMYESLYDWQIKFTAATKDHISCLLMAANQVGKSRTGCIIDAFHLTGDYPEDWPGHRFEHPPLVWLLGYSGTKTRDLLQHKIFGRVVGGKLEGGYIPADLIVDYKSMSNVSGACSEVRVRHAKGISTCQFWSYSQGQHALMGDVVDWYHIDEEPEDQEIYPQVITRTLNGDRNRGGRGIATLTPENGKTEFVCSFMDDPDAQKHGKFMLTATWDDAPHLSQQQKESILAQYPAYQRDMRSRGVPLMGAGLIFEVSESQIKCPRFDIPQHWYLINGMDFGWDHPQAHVQLAIDPDTASIYVTQAWKGSKKQPYEAWHAVKAWAQGVPTAWPHDGTQTRQQLGKQDAVEQRALYEAEGWEMLDEHATWPEGGNGVWVGLTKIIDLMKTGRFKVFADLFDVFEEIREYHTKLNAAGVPVIVKTKDDLLDAIRTAFMMARHAVRKIETRRDYVDEDWYENRRDVGNAMGY